MGGGSWTTCAFDNYSSSVRGMSSASFAKANLSTNQVFKSYGLSPMLAPHKVIRECRDTDEHPNSFPIIIANDVTGSMGAASRKVAQQIGELIEQVLADPNVTDPEFCTMAIGDLAYDRAAIQISQFESDTRIAEQIDQIYFESGGGGNKYESYTAAWYMGARHTDCDCWKRGKKGIIITIGDEGPNPYLPKGPLAAETGDAIQADIETALLLPEVEEKYDVYHLSVDDEDTSYKYHARYNNIDQKWRDLLGDHYKVVGLNELIPTIVGIITSANSATFSPAADDDGYVGW